MKLFNYISGVVENFRQGAMLTGQRYFSGPISKAKRGYEAGRVTRFSSDWIPTSASINKDIREAGRRVRDRSRDLRKNNPYANGYRFTNRANIIGHEGFKLQAQVVGKNEEYDDVVNKEIESVFEEWCKPEYCTMSGRYHFVIVQWMIAEQLKFDGEFLARKIENIDPRENKFGFSLELLDPDDLDETYNEDLRNGEVIVMGVQFDSWRRIKKFHFRSRPVDSEIYGAYASAGSRERIDYDASEIIYGFDPEHPKQVRGMTKLSAIMISLKGVDRWEDASLINATTSAQKMGFLEDSVVDAEGYIGSKRNKKANGENAEDTDADGGKYMDFEHGIIEELPYGKKFSPFDPKFPHEQHQPFLKSMLRKIATGLGLSYNSFANDLEGVNFSSMRSGLLNERDNWMCEQTLFKLLFLEYVFDAFLKNALRTKAINRPYANYELYRAHKWQGRRWPWVDPRADVEASVTAIKNKIKSPFQIIAETGGDIEDVFRDFARAKKLADKYGIDIANWDLTDTKQNTEKVDDGGNKADDENTNRNIIKLAS